MKQEDYDQRILCLANRLLDEIKAAGYLTGGATCECKHVDIWNFPESNTFWIENIQHGWRVRGERDYFKD